MRALARLGGLLLFMAVVIMWVVVALAVVGGVLERRADPCVQDGAWTCGRGGR